MEDFPLNIKDYFFLALCMSLTLLLGLKDSLKPKSNKTDEESEKSYLLGGFKLGPLFTGISIAASHVSGITLLGMPFKSIESGISFANWTFIGWIVGHLLVLKFLSVYHETKTVNNAELIAAVYCRPLVKLVLMMTTGIGLFWAGLMLYNLCLTISTLVPEIDIIVIIFFTTLVVTSYTFIGGYSAVVYTDVMQTGFVIVYAVILTALLFSDSVFNLEKVWGDMTLAKKTSLFSNHHTSINWYRRDSISLIAFGQMVMSFNRIFFSPDTSQRIVACRGGQNGSKLAIIVAIIVTMFIVIALNTSQAIVGFAFGKGCSITNGSLTNLPNDRTYDKNDAIIPLSVVQFCASVADKYNLPIVGIYLNCLIAGTCQSSLKLNVISILIILNFIYFFIFINIVFFELVLFTADKVISTNVSWTIEKTERNYSY